MQLFSRAMNEPLKLRLHQGSCRIRIVQADWLYCFTILTVELLDSVYLDGVFVCVMNNATAR